MNKLHEIYLRRRKSIIVKKGTSNNKKLASALNADLSTLGYTLAGDAIKLIATLNETQITSLHKGLISNLSSYVGSNVHHIPLFRDFPNNIPDDITFLIERYIGYLQNEFGLTRNAKLLSCGHFVDTQAFDLTNFGACPICEMRVPMNELGEAKPRPTLDEVSPLKIIRLGDKESLYKIFTQLIGSKVPISETDQKDVATFIEDVKLDDLLEYIPSSITLKENIAILVGNLLKNYETSDHIVKAALITFIKTATDLLRVLTALSEGDVSLASNVKFRNFKRSERVLFLSILEDIASGKNCVEDMLRYKGKWIRVSEKFHPGEYQVKFPKAFGAFNILRENIKYETFASKVESGILNKKSEVMKTMIQRPGEFVRKLDKLLRTFDVDVVMENLEKILPKISTNVALQLTSYFSNRNKMMTDKRIFFPKGQISKLYVIDEERTKLSANVCEKVELMFINELLSRFSKLDSLGNVSINSELQNYLVPFAMRSASKSLSNIPRGSAVQFDNSNTLRMFIHWMQKDDLAVDLDLSCVFYDTNWNLIDQVSFTHLSTDGVVHSGDLRSAQKPNGSSEFIDVDIKKVLKNRIRYAVMQVYNYTEQTFVDMPICFAGFMERQSPNKGAFHEARTVKNKFDLKGASKTAIPMIFDLQESRAIWVDLSFVTAPQYNCVEMNARNFTLVAKSMIGLKYLKPDLFKLSALHAASRGSEVIVDGKYIDSGESTIEKYQNIMKVRSISKKKGLPEVQTKFDLEDGTYNLVELEKIISELL